MIKFTKRAIDSVTRKVFEVGDVADLGNERNQNAISKGYAIAFEKKEVKPKKSKIEK